MLRGSQVCSALRKTLRFLLGLAYGHRFAALGHWGQNSFLSGELFFFGKKSIGRFIYVYILK